MLAIRTGVAPECWLEDTRAMATAVDVFDEIERDQRRRR